MNYSRMAIAVVCAFVAYMALGGAIFAAVPSLKAEFSKYPNVYRSHEGQMSHFPVGMFGIFLSISVMTVLYAMAYLTRIRPWPPEPHLRSFCSACFTSALFRSAQLRKPEHRPQACTVYSAVAFMLEWVVVVNCSRIRLPAQVSALILLPNPKPLFWRSCRPESEELIADS